MRQEPFHQVRRVDRREPDCVEVPPRLLDEPVLLPVEVVPEYLEQFERKAGQSAQHLGEKERQKSVVRHPMATAPPLVQLRLEREVRQRPLKVHIVWVLRRRLWFRFPLSPKPELPIPPQQFDVEKVP